MHCPACQGSLRQMKLQLVTANICSQCEGIWFDKRQLEWAAKQVAITEKIDPNELSVLFKKRTVIKPDDNEPVRTCPKCLLAMKKINYAYDSNIIIDRCQECQGVWTDKDELKAIGKFIKSDSRMKEIGEALIAENPAIKEIKEIERFGRTMSVAHPSFYGIIAAFAFATLGFIMSRIIEKTNNGNSFNK